MDESFNLECLKTHNELRALHKSPALKLSVRIAEDAQIRADVVARKSQMRQRLQNDFGESMSYSNDMETGEEISLKWYSEIDDYKFGQERQTLASISRFSQLIWKDSSEVGFGRSRFPDGRWVVVGRYVKPGNIVGKFIQNVHQRIIGWEKYPIIMKLKTLLNQKNPIPRTHDENSGRIERGRGLPVKVNDENRTRNKSGNDRDQYDESSSSQRENNPRLRNKKTFTKQEDKFNNINEDQEPWKTKNHKRVSIDDSEKQYSATFGNRKNDLYDKDNRKKEKNRDCLVSLQQENDSHSISDDEDTITITDEKHSKLDKDKANHPPVVLQENTNIAVNDRDIFQSNMDEVDAQEDIIQQRNTQPDFAAIGSKIEDQYNDGEYLEDDAMKEIRQSILAEHNKYRRMHNVNPLKLNSELNRMAQNWADQIGISNQIGNCNETFNEMDLGENIVIQLKGFSYESTHRVVENWYKEIVDFEYGVEPENFDNIGHFTQVVWKATEQLGIGISTMLTYSVIVCFYVPAGNIEGRFLKNVPPVS